MSNLKKILALVLALVMSFSLVTVSSAAYADLKDTDEVSAVYEEAVRVLSDMGIFKGDNLGNFNPKAPITRQEVAAMMYRVISGDVEDAYDGLYVEACKFDDGVASWAKGFVGYCANGGYVKGIGGNNFDPNGNISGTAVLAMILRAVGYDKNNEFTGPAWSDNVLSVATSLGVLENVDESVISLGKPATRELVAELIFRTMVKAQKVTYTPAFGYQTGNYNFTDNKTTIGYDTFELEKSGRVEIDQWGRPGYEWTYNCGEEYTAIAEAPLATYTTAVTECEISADAFRGTNKVVNAYINGNLHKTNNTATKFTIQANDQLSKLGGQGRLMEVYADRLVIIDTFLAQVVAVTPVIKDTAGHRISYAKLYLNIYDGVADAATDTVVLEKASDWDYVRGDMILLNTLTVDAAGTFTNEIFVDPTHNGHGDAIAFSSSSRLGAYTTVLGKAESFVGKQTSIYYFAGQHTVNGTTTPDAITYHLDQAGNSTANFTWYKDTYGNFIGSAMILDSYSYGVIRDIQWFTQNGSAGYAVANMVMMDGTVETKVIAGVYDDNDVVGTDSPALTYAFTTEGSLANKTVSTEITKNYQSWTGENLYQIRDNGNETFTLVDVDNQMVDTNSLYVKDADGGVNPNGTGNVSKNNAVVISSTMLVDSNTKFLFSYDADATYGYQHVFTAYTGFHTIPTYTGATVDYVDLNGDNRAEYVYVLGTPAAAKALGMFYMTTNSHTQVLSDENGLVKAYVLTGYLNGVEGSIQITNDAAGAERVQAMLNDWTANNKNALFQVEFTNGRATAVALVANDATADTLLATAGYTWDLKYITMGADEVIRYTGDTKANAVDTTYTQAYYNGDVLTVTSDNGTGTPTVVVYDIVEGATRVMGELIAGKTYGTGYTVHVVYDTATADKDVTEIYVFANPSTPNNGSPALTNSITIAQIGHTISGQIANSGAIATVAYEYKLLNGSVWATWALDANTTTGPLAGTTLTNLGAAQVYEVRAVGYSAGGSVGCVSNSVYLQF